MTPSLRTSQRNGKDYAFCPFRHKWVRLTPEEQVRQRFLQLLTGRYGYPASRIAVEAALPTGQRADAVVYDRNLRPAILIEFKAPSVAVTPATLDQAAVYNRLLQVPLLVLHNGTQTVIANVQEDNLIFLTDLPQYGETD